MARQGKLKRHDGSEANAMAAKTSVNASLPSLHDKRYPYLTLRSPSNLGGNTCKACPQTAVGGVSDPQVK